MVKILGYYHVLKEGRAYILILMTFNRKHYSDYIYARYCHKNQKYNRFVKFKKILKKMPGNKDYKNT